MVTAAPWSWYAIRNLGGPMQVVAVLIPVIAATIFLLLAIIAAARRNLLALLAGLSVVTFGFVTVIQPLRGVATPAPADRVRIASANVYGRNDVPQQAIAALLGQHADVVVAVESAGGLSRRLRTADPQLTFWVVSDELALGSRFPVRMLSLSRSLDPVRAMRVEVDRPVAPFVVYVVHDLNPLFDRGWNRQLNFDRALRDAALREHLPVVLAGDFNLSDRTEGYRLLATSFRDAMRVGGGAADTYVDGFWRFLFLRPDQVFVSRSWCADEAGTFDVPGSDHQGIAVTTGPCP